MGAAAVAMHSTTNHAEPFLKDYDRGRITLRECQDTCVAQWDCYGIEPNSNTADPNAIVNCRFMYSGTKGGTWTLGSCWHYKIDGAVQNFATTATTITTSTTSKSVVVEWVQETRSECRSSSAELAGAKAAAVAMHSTTNHAEPFLKDYDRGRITLRECQDTCVAQ